MGMVGAAIMTDFLFRGIGQAIVSASVPGSAANPAAACPRQDSVKG